MLTSTLSTETFLGNDTATEFPFHFQAWTNTNGDPLLRVYTVDPDGVATLTTDWSVVLDEGGGTLTYPQAPGDPLPTGWKLVILRDMDFLQQTDYVNGRAFNPETMESALDRLTAQDQQILEMLGRALLVSPGGENPTDLLNAGIAAAAEAETAQGAAEAAQGAAEAAQLAAEEAEAEAKAAQIVAETARDSALAAAAGLSGARLDALDRGLAAEAYRRAMGDLVSARGYFLNGWIDPLADAGEVTITNGSFVAADGGYITNAGADNVVTAVDLTTAQFLDEKGNITTFTCDTANTSGHFNTAGTTRVKAGCRMVIAGTSYPIVSISGDGTAANSVVFSGTLTTGAKTVSGIYGCIVDSGSVKLNSYCTQSATDICTGGTASASTTYGGYVAANACDDDNTSCWISGDVGTSLPAWWRYNLPVAKRVYQYNIYMDINFAYSPRAWEFQGSNNGTTWTTLDSRTGQTWSAAGIKNYTVPAANRGTYLYYRLYITDGGGNSPDNYIWIYEFSMYAETYTYPSAVTYPLSLTVDCTDWTALKALAATETLNSQNIWYALSFDGGTTYSAFSNGAWKQVIRLSGGVWQYLNSIGEWQGAIPNALLAMTGHALVAAYRMTGATMAALSQAQIEGAGGFTGGQTTLPVLAAMYSSSTTATPVLSAMSMTSDIQAHDAVFEFDAFEAVDPDTGIVVFPMEAVDTLTVGADLKAWLKRGSGAYQEITLHQGEQFDAAVFLYYGDVDMSAGTGDATQFKLTCHNHKELRVFMVENHFRSV